MDPDLIERDAIASGDYEVKPAYRRYARLWLRRDYLDAIKRKPEPKGLEPIQSP